MAEYHGVMIYGEVIEGNLATISTEILGCGRKLADELEEELSAVLVGSGASDKAKDAIAFGADKVYVVDDPLLQDYQTDSYLSAVEKVVKQVMPQILIMGQTSVGRDLAPRLAFRLDTAASLDCIELAIDPDTKRLLQTKPVYGGNAQAIFTTESNPQIVTVRVKAMSPLERDESRKGEVITIDAGLDASAIRTKVLEKVKAGAELEGPAGLLQTLALFHQAAMDQCTQHTVAGYAAQLIDLSASHRLPVGDDRQRFQSSR